MEDNQKYDVGIMGVWVGCNYGSIATYYALNRIISDMGYSVLMIDKASLTNEHNDIELSMTHSRKFAMEHYHISKPYKISELKELNKICDIFVIGSDQVWNYGISRNFGKSYYFDFVEDSKKKIAYASSFGHGIDFAPTEEVRKISEFMRSFDAISVREADGVKLLRDVYNIKGEQVLDPVFVADRGIFDILAEKSSYQETEPYIATYILDPTPDKREAMLHISRKLGYKLINMLDGLPWLYEENSRKMGLESVQNLHVEDWISIIKNSKFVITDSCHGASFAILYEKNFIPITNVRRGYSRFKSLADLFGFADRLVTEPNTIINNELLLRPLDYIKINTVLHSEKERCRKWLKNALESPKEKHPDKKLSETVDIIVKSKICTGCGACAELCPVNAIDMKINEEGFLYPFIDKEKCIRCGLCEKRCPSKKPVYKNEHQPKCYAMMAPDEVRKISSSGGMFTIAAEYIIDHGGYVCGAAYKNDFTVEHIIVNRKEELYRLRGSKYMQSCSNNIYADIKQLLDAGNLVLFTGMPCQIAGLYAFLEKEYDMLYTMDLLCHGITSPKVFQKYHMDILAGKKIRRLEFKEKEPWGWHAGVNAYFEDGSKYSEPLERDMFFIAYLRSLSKNTSCGVCRFNRLPRQGDLTIGDFWGINRSDPELYDGKGTSLILVNNKKGGIFFDTLKDSMKNWKKELLDSAIQGNHIITAPYVLHKNRDAFFANFNILDFASLTLGCFHNNLYKMQKTHLNKFVPEQEHYYYYLAKITAENSSGRSIVAWINSPIFERILLQYFHLKIDFSVTMFPEKIVNSAMKMISVLNGARNKFYVVAPELDYNEQFYTILSGYGFSEIEDFVFRNHRPIIIEKYDCSKGRYEDDYGNTIDGYAGIIEKVIFHKGNNHIVLGNQISHSENLSFELVENSYVEIGNECYFHDKTEIKVFGKKSKGNGEIIIKDKCRFRNALFVVYINEYTSSVLINDSCTFESDFELHANAGKKIVIGRDCMFSHNVNLWAGDGHTIFSILTGKNLNSDYTSQPENRNRIIVGEHVWISKGAFVLHGSNIGNGSIIGAQSVVKEQYPNNCIIAGNPSHLVKKDIAWSREMVAYDMRAQCGGIQYVQHTDECNTNVNDN